MNIFEQHVAGTNLPWLEKNTILYVPTGSYAYGTNTENSDHDYKGVCIPPKEYYFGLESFNEYNKSGGKDFKQKNTKDDVDVTIIHVNKFVRDAMQGVPNNIEILFVRPEDFIVKTALGNILVENRHLFLSKHLKKKFGGYAKSQMEKLNAKRSNGTGRQDLINAFGYDTKFFMQSIRLLTSCIEILETGDYNTYRPNRNLLLDCRNGLYSFEQAIDMIEHFDADLQEAEKRSSLPALPDYHAINKMLMHINEVGLHLLNQPY